MSASIAALRPNGVIPKETLYELAQMDGLESYVVVCNWEDGTSSAYWSNMKIKDLAFSMVFLQAIIQDHILED